MAETLTLEAVSVAYGRIIALEGLDLRLPAGRITVLAGPNGCGKSTLLRAIRRLLRPKEGSIRLADEDMTHLPERALARRIALLTQSPTAPDDLAVFDLVRLGRYPHQSFVSQWTPADARAVDRAIAATGLEGLRTRPLGTLSGGQRQRVWLAMVLAQDTPIICLDEPINHLDVAHQLDCLELIRQLNRELGKTVIIVLHDLNLAARYADNLVILKAGRVFATGAPATLVTKELVRSVFGIDSQIIRDPVHHSPLCIPIATRAGRAIPGDETPNGDGQAQPISEYRSKRSADGAT